MIYELRTYDAFPGKLPALSERFADVALGYFEKHGMKVIGCWQNSVGENTTNRLILMLAFEDGAQREAAWDSFLADPDRHMAFIEPETDGLLVQSIASQLMSPTPYSPLK
jgi:NIPSNAP